MNFAATKSEHAHQVGRERRYLTAREVGNLLGLSRSRVYELAGSGILPTIRLGRRILFIPQALDELEHAAIARAVAMQSRLTGAVEHGTTLR